MGLEEAAQAKYTNFPFFKKQTIFNSRFRFTAKLRGKYRHFPYTAPPPHTRHNLPSYQHTNQNGTFVSMDEPTLML